MTAQEIDAEVIGERRHLLSLAFRMLGTVAEAETPSRRPTSGGTGWAGSNATPSRSPAPG
jgi:hypothetical protein